MMGIGETYLSAFALFLKASTPQIGLLASLPPLLGSLAQLLSAWLRSRYRHGDHGGGSSGIQTSLDSRCSMR
jgi:hypothetical protein